MMRLPALIFVASALALMGGPAAAGCYTFVGEDAVQFDLGMAPFEPDTIEPAECTPEVAMAALEVFEDMCVIEHPDDPNAEVVGTPEEVEEYMKLADTYCPGLYDRLLPHRDLIGREIPRPNYNDPM